MKRLAQKARTTSTGTDIAMEDSAEDSPLVEKSSSTPGIKRKTPTPVSTTLEAEIEEDFEEELEEEDEEEEDLNEEMAVDAVAENGEDHSEDDNKTVFRASEVVSTPTPATSASSSKAPARVNKPSNSKGKKRKEFTRNARSTATAAPLRHRSQHVKDMMTRHGNPSNFCMSHMRNLCRRAGVCIHAQSALRALSAIASGITETMAQTSGIYADSGYRRTINVGDVERAAWMRFGEKVYYCRP